MLEESRVFHTLFPLVRAPMSSGWITRYLVTSQVRKELEKRETDDGWSGQLESNIFNYGPKLRWQQSWFHWWRQQTMIPILSDSTDSVNRRWQGENYHVPSPGTLETSLANMSPDMYPTKPEAVSIDLIFFRKLHSSYSTFNQITPRKSNSHPAVLLIIVWTPSWISLFPPKWLVLSPDPMVKKLSRMLRADPPWFHNCRPWHPRI